MKYLYRCQLCKVTFEVPNIENLLAAPSGQSDLARIVGNLALHMEKYHPEEAMSAIIAAQEFAGFLKLRHYYIPDKSGEQMREWMRHKLFAMVRRFTIPDEHIIEQVTALNLPDDRVQDVIRLVRTMRDILEERGPFEPPEPGTEAAKTRRELTQ